MNETFEANDRTWKTDSETLALLRRYRAAGDSYMLGMVFEMGKAGGRIIAA